MEPQAIKIRRATGKDAEVVAELGALLFVEAVGDDVDPQDLQRYVGTAFSPEKIAGEIAEASSRFLLAFGAEGVVGYAHLREGTPPACVTGPQPVELVRIYVNTVRIGTGVGKALMQTCLEEARRGHDQTIWLGVWENNHRAIDFYDAWGFRKVGTRQFVLGRAVHNDLIMERPVGPKA
jgi:diamine N-acetyltransferase